MPTIERSDILRRRDFLRQAWTSDESYGSTLLVMLVDAYGPDALEWHPQTIKMQVKDDFDVELPQSLCDRLMAAIAVVTTNYFYADLKRFCYICEALSGNEIDPDVFDPPDVKECAWGLSEGVLLNPPDDGETFAEDIQHYLASILEAEGFIRPPRIFRHILGDSFREQMVMDFSDDKDLAAAVWKMQEQKTQEVDDMVRDGMRDLVMQISSLPLRTGDARDLVKRMQRDLHGKRS